MVCCHMTYYNTRRVRACLVPVHGHSPYSMCFAIHSLQKILKRCGSRPKDLKGTAENNGNALRTFMEGACAQNWRCLFGPLMSGRVFLKLPSLVSNPGRETHSIFGRESGAVPPRARSGQHGICISSVLDGAHEYGVSRRRH